GVVIGGNACAGVQRRRSHPVLTAGIAGGGELHPPKWATPCTVTTLNRGAPAPQCEPLRISYPSSVSTMPFTFFMSTPADAKLAVGPVFTSNSPSNLLSLSSPVGQPVSSYMSGGPPNGTKRAWVGHPMPR